MTMCRSVSRLGSAFVLLFLLASCASTRPDFKLSIAHMNDTHSHLEETPVTLTIAGEKTTARLGGFARVKTVVDDMRRENPRLLFLHGGDAVQGTLFFTLFNGTLDFDLLNRVGVDAMTFGNHEFDRGTGALATYLGLARFPLLSSNIDFSGEPAIARLVAPSVIKVIEGERVGIIGVTTDTTPLTTMDVGKSRFLDPRQSVRLQVEKLTSAGVNKIVVVSHLGFDEDLGLAAAVPGIDVIVGGHSHTMLGAGEGLANLGIKPEGAYPAVVVGADGSKTLVVQAWQWAHFLGRVDVTFTPDGRVGDFAGIPTIPMGAAFSRKGADVDPSSASYRAILDSLKASGTARVVAEDREIRAMLEPYSAKLADFRGAVLGTVVNDVVRGLNSGPGPLVADSMMAALPNSNAALLNYGGVRRDILPGPISVGDVLELMPFGNTLVVVDLTGDELRNALEEGIEFLRARYPGQNPPALPFVANIRLTLNSSAVQGKRIQDLSVKDATGAYQPIVPTQIYRTVVNTFIANGGDGFATIKGAKGFRADSGIIDSDALRQHIKTVGSVRNPDDPRVTLAD